MQFVRLRFKALLLRHHLRGRNQLGRIALCFARQALVLDAGLHQIALRSEHGLRYLHIVEAHARHPQASARAVEQLLERGAERHRERRARGAGHQLGDRPPGDGFARDRFGKITQQRIGIAHRIQRRARIDVLILNAGRDIHEHRIAGVHARLELHAVLLAQIDRRECLERPRQVPTGTASTFSGIGAETLQHAALTVIELIKAGGQPERRGQSGRCGIERPARVRSGFPALAPAPHPATARALAPAAAPRLGALIIGGLIPGHGRLTPLQAIGELGPGRAPPALQSG